MARIGRRRSSPRKPLEKLSREDQFQVKWLSSAIRLSSSEELCLVLLPFELSIAKVEAIRNACLEKKISLRLLIEDRSTRWLYELREGMDMISARARMLREAQEYWQSLSHLFEIEQSELFRQQFASQQRIQAEFEKQKTQLLDRLQEDSKLHTAFNSLVGTFLQHEPELPDTNHVPGRRTNALHLVQEYFLSRMTALGPSFDRGQRHWLFYRGAEQKSVVQLAGRALGEPGGLFLPNEIDFTKKGRQTRWISRLPSWAALHFQANNPPVKGHRSKSGRKKESGSSPRS